MSSKKNVLRKVIILILIFIVLSEITTAVYLHYSKSKTPVKSDNDCIVCHGDISNTDTLSIKARGKTNLIFFHSTHVQARGIPCAACHDEKDYHTKHPAMQGCLTCHDDNLASNDCQTCHANPEDLDL